MLPNAGRQPRSLLVILWPAELPRSPPRSPQLAPADGEQQRLASQVAGGAQAAARRGRFHLCPSLLPLPAGRRAPLLLLLSPFFPPAAGSGLRLRTVSTSATVSSSQEKEKGGKRLGKVFPALFLELQRLVLAEVCRSPWHCFAGRLPLSRPSLFSFGPFRDQSISFVSGGEDSGVTNHIFNCFPFLHNTDSTKGYSLSRDLHPGVR